MGSPHAPGRPPAAKVRIQIVNPSEQHQSSPRGSWQQPRRPQHRRELQQRRRHLGARRPVTRQRARDQRRHIRRAPSAARATTCQACAQRSWPPSAIATDATAVRTANARSLRSGNTNPAGSSSTASGSGRSRCSSQERNSSAAPSPTAPSTSAARASSDACAASQAASSRATASQLRGLGHPRPASADDRGSASASAGRTSKKAPTAARAAIVCATLGAFSIPTIVARGKPTANPFAICLPSTGQSRCTSRFASGAASSQPSAASSGGFAAATTRTPSGSFVSPTTRSSTTRNIAACTAGGAVVSSSRNNSPAPASHSRVAQPGGDRSTDPSMITGSPAKSLGSRIDPITVSTGHPSASPKATTAEVLPVPGLPHSSTGTPADTATASASKAIEPSMHREYPAPATCPRRPSWAIAPITSTARCIAVVGAAAHKRWPRSRRGAGRPTRRE